MRRAFLIIALLLAALPAKAAEPIYVGQVPLLPLPEGDQPDIEALVGANWKAYWHASGEHGLTRDNIRVGRFDFDGDGRAELVLMIDKDSWVGENGKPLMVAGWTKKGWLPIGWGWGDEDNVFVSRETIGGWHSIDTGRNLMRWTGKAYQLVEKPD
ncbi:MAG: hypothetical protein ACM33T_13335 [Solirubrobacterales bacterium]